MNIFFTVCNRTELPNAIALGSSVVKHHPDAKMIIGWVDEAPVPAFPAELIRLSVKLIAIPDWPSMYERYFDFELVAACRPWFARYILKTNPECQRLIFLSPTTFLYQSVPLDELPQADLLLTPHLTQPLPSNKNLDDKRILNIGMYHSGAWILTPGAATGSFLDWWANRTLDRAAFDLCQGMCLDQLWLNYAPVWVQNYSLIDRPDWHLGLHSVLNYNAHDKARDTNHFPVSADFAGLASYHPVWSDHISLLKDNPFFTRLYQEYQWQLRQYKAYRIGNTPSYGRMAAIKGNRSTRKGIVRKLKSVLSIVDQFEIKR